MRFFAVFLCGLLVCVASCGPSVPQACDDYAAAWCNRHYDCATGASLTSLQQSYGMTAAACANSFAALSNCTSAQSPCPLGTSYDTGIAEQCVASYANSSCDDINKPTFVPTVGDKKCDLTFICH